MGVIAVSLGVGRPGDDEAAVARMLAAVPWRGAAAPLRGPTFALAATDLSRDPGSGLYLAADARLDEVDGGAPDGSAGSGIGVGAPNGGGDARLRGAQSIDEPGTSILATWARHSEATPERLHGDFAFVIWDEQRRAGFAVRDRLGVKPLVWAKHGGGILIATEVQQLQAARGDDPPLDDGAVLAFLLGRPERTSETFFQGFHRLPPGHLLRFSAGEVTVTRWFRPPPTRRFASAAAAESELRDLLHAAVAARLPVDGPAATQLSGGLDSSAITCLAARIREQRGRAHALTAISAGFEGLGCDERAYAELVLRHTGLPGLRFDGRPADFVYRHDPSQPDRTSSMAFAQGWRHHARALGAQVVLCGVGGDELLFERGVFRDLAAHGQLARLWREVHGTSYTSRSRGFYLIDVVRGLLPARARELYRRARPHADTTMPSWIAEPMRALPGGAPHAPAPRLDSHTQDFTWQWLTLPRLALILELEEMAAARAGLEVRFPFLDSRLVELVLSIPWQLRVPGGRMKNLLRRALADLLPPAIADRRDITSFDELYRIQVERQLPIIRDTLDHGPWLSARWVDRAAARRLVAELTAHPDPVGWQPAREVWDIALLELWLRNR